MEPVPPAKMKSPAAVYKPPNVMTGVAPHTRLLSARGSKEQHQRGRKTCFNGMIVTETEIPDLLIIEPKLIGDQRGFFLETFQLERYQSCGIKGPFIQDNYRVQNAACCAHS